MFAVIWRDNALDDLADAWVTASLQMRAVIESRIADLNKRLASDPMAEGESREGKRRIVFDAPVVLTCLVDQADRVVRVTHFRLY